MEDTDPTDFESLEKMENVPDDVKFLLRTTTELHESANPEVRARLKETETRYRAQFEYHAMKLCGLYEASKAGSNAVLDYERCEMLLDVCGNLEKPVRLMHTDRDLARFIKNIMNGLANNINRDDAASWILVVRDWEVRKFHNLFKDLPIVAMMNLANLPSGLVEKYAMPSPEQHVQIFDSRLRKSPQGALRKTLKRLLENGQGGRLSMPYTVLLLERLTTCIKENVILRGTSMRLIPSILFKLQGCGIDSAFHFDQKEIGTLLDIYDSTARSYEAATEPVEVPTNVKVRGRSTLTHDIIDMVLHTNDWMEEALEILEEVVWKDIGAEERARSRASLVEALSYYDTLPKDIFLASFNLQLQIDSPFSPEHSGISLDHTAEEELQPWVAMMAAKISVESKVAMGKGRSLLPRMYDGIDALVRSLTNLRSQREKDVEIILHLQKQVAAQGQADATRSKLLTSLQEERSESRVAIESLKEALKDTKEKNRECQNRQEKEREAIFNSLNRKIGERNKQLEAATSRIKDLERALRKTETQGAKEIKKEQAKVIATEEAQDKTRAELMTTKADLEAVEASRATLETKLETFKEKQREFARKAEIIKKELDERKAADSISRATQDMIDAMVAKAIRETVDAKEKEFAERIVISNRTRDEDLKCKIEEVQMKDIQLKRKDDDLARKAEELMLMESLLEDKDRKLEAADEKYALLQSTVRDHFAQKRKLAESQDKLEGMLD